MKRDVLVKKSFFVQINEYLDIDLTLYQYKNIYSSIISITNIFKNHKICFIKTS